MIFTSLAAEIWAVTGCPLVKLRQRGEVESHCLQKGVFSTKRTKSSGFSSNIQCLIFTICTNTYGGYIYDLSKLSHFYKVYGNNQIIIVNSFYDE